LLFNFLTGFQFVGIHKTGILTRIEKTVRIH